MQLTVVHTHFETKIINYHGQMTVVHTPIFGKFEYYRRLGCGRVTAHLLAVTRTCEFESRRSSFNWEQRSVTSSQQVQQWQNSVNRAVRDISGHLPECMGPCFRAHSLLLVVFDAAWCTIVAQVLLWFSVADGLRAPCLLCAVQQPTAAVLPVVSALCL